MCLTVPLQVEEVNGKLATLQDGRVVSTVLVKNLKKGDFVMAQANLALEKVSASKVLKMKKLMESNI